MKKKMVLVLALILLVASVAFAGGAKETAGTKKGYKIAVVPKLTSIAWFQRMEVGVKEYAKETGVEAFYTGPSEGDGALQAQAIEDLISQGVDAICVVQIGRASCRERV